MEDVEYVLTLNEPSNYASFSYLLGEWPPQQKNLLKFCSVYWNLARAHRNAYKILKTQKPSAQVGMAAILANIQAKHPHNFFDQMSTKIMRYIWNWWFLKRIKRHMDFVGMNYYFSDYYTGIGKRENPKVPVSDLGWYAEPEGLYPIMLRTWSRFKKPIFITESGIADEDDQYRHWWIEENIVAMERALSEGVDIRGYFYWSLLDNFEWSYGWWPKFGLVSVDRERNMKRTIRPSAKWFADWLSKLN
jgi:beta-glucosidase